MAHDRCDYERIKRNRITECCTCFLEPNGGRRVVVLPYEELKRRVDDVMLQGDQSFEAWDERVLAERTARGVSIGEYFERPWAFAWCGTFRHYTCTCDGHGDEDRVLPDIPSQNCDHSPPVLQLIVKRRAGGHGTSLKKVTCARIRSHLSLLH